MQEAAGVSGSPLAQRLSPSAPPPAEGCRDFSRKAKIVSGLGLAKPSCRKREIKKGDLYEKLRHCPPPPRQPPSPLA